MKINTKYTGLAAIAAAAAIILPACNDFLDVAPESSFTNEEIFSSEAETKAMLNTIYTRLCNNNLYGFALPHTFNTNTDVEMKTASTQVATSANGDEVHCFDMRPIWTSLENTWNLAYETINYCNDFLENIQDSPLFSHDVDESHPTAMQQMYGEVKCIRAMLYLDLIRTWGDVVWRTSSSKVGDDFYHEGTTDRNKILSSLINDLIETEHYMRYASDIDEGVERASREYCQALIGQLALYRGGYSLRPGAGIGTMERESDYLEYYKIAKTYLGKVISENHHSLDNESFEQMWINECNWTVINNGDVLFEIPMLKESNGNYGYNIGITIGYDSENPSHRYGQATNRVTLCGLYPFTFDMRDLRFDMTCVPVGYDENLNQTIAVGRSCVAGWGIGKWSKLYMGSTLTSTTGSTGINAIRMRYADVLLMYAEVENEINGPTNDAKEKLKMVRRRAFKPEDHNEMVESYVNALASPKDFFKAIMNERAWEFGGEGIRKYDLARWNKYGEKLKYVYDTLTDWGRRAQGQGVKEDVRDYIYYRVTPESANTGREVYEFMGIKEYGDNIGEHPASEGWKSYAYAANWWTLNRETDQWEVHDDIKWSFRGFINVNNASSVQATDPVRYICPYPTRIITSHRGSIQQQYGYN